MIQHEKSKKYIWISFFDKKNPVVNWFEFAILTEKIKEIDYFEDGTKMKISQFWNPIQIVSEVVCLNYFQYFC